LPRRGHLKPEKLVALNAALKDADPMVSSAIKLLLFTGCRVSEVVNLDWNHVDTKAGIFTLDDAKAGPRDVQLSAPALAVLSGLGTSEGRVFGDLNYNALDKAWRRIRANAGLDDARLHDLRHTVGTLAGATGANAFQIRDMLGHKTLAMSNRYVEANPVKTLTEKVSRQVAAAFTGKEADIIDHPKAGRR